MRRFFRNLRVAFCMTLVARIGLLASATAVTAAALALGAVGLEYGKGEVGTLALIPMAVLIGFPVWIATLFTIGEWTDGKGWTA